MKTIKEWLEQLPEPYRTQALEAPRRCGYELSDKIDNLPEAIARGLNWQQSEQGYDYWDYIYDRAASGKFDKPAHYAKAIQPIEYIEANGLDFSEGNVVKYVTRWKEKGGVDDLKKAKWYIERLIEKA